MDQSPKDIKEYWLTLEIVQLWTQRQGRFRVTRTLWLLRREESDFPVADNFGEIYHV